MLQEKRICSNVFECKKLDKSEYINKLGNSSQNITVNLISATDRKRAIISNIKPILFEFNVNKRKCELQLMLEMRFFSCIYNSAFTFNIQTLC